MSSGYDAIVVGAGPNGLSAAITLQQQGLSVLLLEKRQTIGGGLRSAELTLPGFIHDVCSAVHPLAIASPFFNTLPLDKHGLEFIQPTIPAAHPFDDGTAAHTDRSIDTTAGLLHEDGATYKNLIGPLTREWPELSEDLLGPLRFPGRPLPYAQFGLKAIQSAARIARRFKTTHARGLWAGMAAHAIQPLTNVASSAIAMVLLASAHLKGWPIPRGGSQQLANALSSYFQSIGGHIQTGFHVKSLQELPPSKAVFLDLTPAQILKLAGNALSAFYRSQLSRYRYGMGVFKIDWALHEPVPFPAIEARLAGTVHLGGTFEEIAASEQLTSDGSHPAKPFVLFAQPSLFDPSRAPSGKHTAWAYCHVPNGSTVDMTAAIEAQVERFAPGFQQRILARHTMNTVQMESYNPNYVGGDINGGIIDIGQLYTRPALRLSPYRTSATGIYICSSSTPPGGGVHGMCGYHAARQGLKDLFGIVIDLKTEKASL